MGILKNLFKKGREIPKKEPGKKSLQLRIDPEGGLRIEDTETKAQETICPYCQKELEKRPQRKSRCPFCDNYIYIRDDNLITEQRANEIDEERMREAERRSLLDKLEDLNISEAEFDARSKELSNKIRIKPNYINVILSVFNEKVLKIKDFGMLSSLYHSMAILLNKENKECFHFRFLSEKMKLQALKKEGYKETEIMAGCCLACDKLEGKILSIEEALKTMPIPNKECTHGFCVCMYEGAGEVPFDY